VSSAAAESASRGTKLKLLTFNVFQRSPGSPGGADGYLSEEYKDQRLDGFCRRLEDSPEYGDSLDLICCQEMFAFGQWRQEKLLATAARLGFRGYACSPNVDLLGGWGNLLGDWARTALAYAPNLTKWIDGGVMILSRYPVLESRTLEFANASGGDMFAAKGPVYLRIQHPNPSVGVVHVFSMHLQASENFRHKDGATEEEVAIRSAQVGELLAFIEDCVAPADPADATVLLAGDWNIDAHADRFEEKSMPGGLAAVATAAAPGSPPAELPPSSPPGGSAEYRALLRQLRSRMPQLRDLVLEASSAKPTGGAGGGGGAGFHPVTYGALRESDGEPVDTVLTEKDERGCQAFVDYIFLSEAAAKAPSSRTATAAAGGGGGGAAAAGAQCSAVTKVDQMECDASVVGCAVLSDHYALSCELTF